MSTAVSTALVIVLLAIGGADFWFKERPQHLPPQASSSSSASSIDSSSGNASSSSHAPVRKGVSKQALISIDEIMQGIGVTMQTTQEKSLLERINPSTSTTVQTKILLKDNDRAALFAWMDTPDAKTIFFALKQSLLPSLSPQTTDLIDQTVEPEDGPPYDLLSFTDPALSSGKLVFVRVRTRLFLLEVSPDKESAMRAVLDALIR